MCRAVRAAAQGKQVRAGGRKIGRLVEPLFLAHEQLVRSDDDGAGLDEVSGLPVSQVQRGFVRAGAPGLRRALDERLVDRSGLRGDQEAGFLQQGKANARAAGKDQRRMRGLQPRRFVRRQYWARIGHVHRPRDNGVLGDDQHSPTDGYRVLGMKATTGDPVGCTQPAVGRFGMNPQSPCRVTMRRLYTLWEKRGTFCETRVPRHPQASTPPPPFLYSSFMFRR